MKLVAALTLCFCAHAWADFDLTAIHARFDAVLADLSAEKPITRDEAAIATKLARSRIKAILADTQSATNVNERNVIFIGAKTTERLAARRIVLASNYGAILRELRGLEREGIVQAPVISVHYANPGLDVTLRYFNKVKGQTVEVEFSILNRVNDLVSVIEPIDGWRDLIVYGGPWDLFDEKPRELDYETIWVQNIRFNAR